MAIGTITSVSADDSAGDVLGNASDDELGIEEIDDLEIDDSENAESLSDDGNNEIIESDSQDVDGDVLGADDGTFTALQNKIKSASEGSTITLYNDYRYNDDFRSGYTFIGFPIPGINIKKSITINGNGHSIDGASKSILFWIESDNVKLTNLVLKNANASQSLIDSVPFGISNAIDWTGNNGVLDNCSCIGVSGSNVRILYIRGDNSAIKNCIFKDTRAVSLNGNGNAIDNCNFTNSIAKGYCDCVDVSGKNNRLTNSNFKNCRAGDRGAAVSFSGEKNNIAYCNFRDCSSEAYSFYEGNAGAVYFSSTSGVIDHCNFFDTYASNNGGAILITKYVSGVTVSYCNFNNTRAKTGGAIYRATPDNAPAATDLTVNNCIFAFCHADEGGAIYSDSNNEIIRYCKFDDCSADSTGGAILFNESCAGSTVSDCDFNRCTAVEYSGAVDWNGDNGVLTKCNFIDCNAEEGGALYWCDNGGKVSNSNFIRCTGKYAGAIDWEGNRGSISYCNFNDCNVSEYGGAVYWDADNTKMESCNFNNCNATYGGAIYCAISVNNGYLSGCKFTGCNASGRGGAMYLNCPKNFKVSSSTFSGNSAGSGGAIAAYNSTVFKVDSSTFTDNVASISGGAVFATEGYGAQFDSSSFIHNSAQEYYGGAISVSNMNITIMDSCTFERNYANDSAGAIYLSSLEQSIVRYSTFLQNSAKYCGGVAALHVDSPYVISSKFVENTDTGYGGAVYGVIAADCEFIGNSNPQTCSTTEFPGSSITIRQTGSYFNDKVVTATLIGRDGALLSNQKVNVTLNGKTSVYTTNAKGQISFKVNLVPKTYEITVIFGGNAKYYSSSEKANVVIKKATPKMSAAKKTFRLKVKTKKYSITLKDNLGKAMKGKKVTITVKGKTYSAKTSSKGKATFKITKLKKKGKFTGVVKYGGDQYYNKVTKKVKITVKK